MREGDAPEATGLRDGPVQFSLEDVKRAFRTELAASFPPQPSFPPMLSEPSVLALVGRALRRLESGPCTEDSCEIA